MESTRKAIVTGDKSKLVMMPRTAPTERDNAMSPLVSYRPPQAGQKPVNKALLRNYPPASFVAWSSVSMNDKRMKNTQLIKHR
ncbi:hypothetical protein DPMN_011936 [Dreissena polymorpha]|uniref:Uncharacterized protein n=1 Tax=Dreissena polymorpha TaxID=45954 RepID=A0A9D4N626_DREPO|nr:hypothetical protein DPMN_011936 [Dreissena polymorpha]